MIKRILIALDPDEDTPVATQYAISLAKSNDASVTELAVCGYQQYLSNEYNLGSGSSPHARNLW